MHFQPKSFPCQSWLTGSCIHSHTSLTVHGCQTYASIADHFEVHALLQMRYAYASMCHSIIYKVFRCCQAQEKPWLDVKCISSCKWHRVNCMSSMVKIVFEK